MNYYRRYIGDYGRDTTLLSLAEHGAYALLLDHYYASEGPLPADREDVYRVARAVKPDERKAVDRVLAKYFTEEPDGFHNSRADAELDRAQPAIEAAKANGKRGAEANWGQSAKATRSQRLAEARTKGTHTPEEWKALIEVCGSKCLICNTPMDELNGGTVCKDHIIPIYLGGSDAIDNLQPLCRQCNTGKRKDTTDHRPNDWQERLAKCLANGEESQTECQAKRLAIRAGDPTTNHHPPTASHQKPLRAVDTAPAGFVRFWEAWPRSPRKVGKAACVAKWVRLGLEAKAPEIIAHVDALKNSEQWRSGFDPAPLTFINQRRWEDGPPVGGSAVRDQFAGAL